jgi:hypothetical protein
MRLGEQVDKTLLRQAAKVADDIRAGFRASLPNVDRVVSDFLNSHPAGVEVSKVEARAWAKTHIKLNNGKLSDAISRTLAVGYVLGQDFARAAYAEARQNAGRKLKAGTPGLSASSGYWASWTPGNRAAAALVDKPGGLARLLERQPREELLNGLDNTTLDRIGTRLADGLALGLGDGAIAQSLSDVLSDPSRALMVATTEMNAATSVATRDNYEALGVDQVEWFALDGCDDCEENAGAGPIPMGDEFPSGDSEPPAHTNCRCCLLPFIEGDSEALRGDGEDGEGFVEETGAVSGMEIVDMEGEDLPYPDMTTPELVEGVDYTSQSLEVAQSLLDEARAVEPAITSDMVSLAQANDGEMFGLDYRLKTEESLATKIFKDAEGQFSGDLVEAADNIKDAVRYTMIFDESTYVAGVTDVMSSLEAKGYEVVKFKNNWATDGYKGVNVQMRSPSGHPMELQFHTPTGIHIKEDVSHPLYKQLDKVLREQPASDWVEKLNQRIDRAWASVPIPTGASSLAKMITVAKAVGRRLLSWA